MHICFCSHYFPPEGNAPASRTYENARRWVKAGHKVTVITCAPNVPDGKVYEGYRNRLYQREKIDDIDVIRVWTYMAPNAGTWPRIMNYVSYMFSAFFFGLFVRKIDIIIATSPQFFCGWAGLLLSKIRRIPFILEIRDIWPESIVAVGAMQNKKVLRVVEWMEVKMYKWSYHIVTVGAGYKRRLIEKGVNSDKISIVMNGIDREIFKPQERDTEILQEYGLENKFVCSYVGTIGMACGLDVVVRAAKEMKDSGRNETVFLLVGDGAFRERLEKQTEELGLDNVIFTGRQPKNLIPALLAITDVCLVHLRKTDLFTTVMPSKIFEAGGMGKPVAIGVEGYASEFVEKAGGGLAFEPENEKALIEVLQQFKDNPGMSNKMGQSLKNYVTINFDRDKLADSYLRIIQSVALGKSPALVTEISAKDV